LVEIFGLKEGWHASFVMAELIKAKHIAQVLAFFYCPIAALTTWTSFSSDLCGTLKSQHEKIAQNWMR
jgi:hypothetical protein